MMSFFFREIFCNDLTIFSIDRIWYLTKVFLRIFRNQESSVFMTKFSFFSLYLIKCESIVTLNFKDMIGNMDFDHFFIKTLNY